MDPKWFPPVIRPLRPNELVLFPCVLICVSSFLLPSGRARRLLTLPPLLYGFMQVRRTTSGIRAADYLLPINMTFFAYKYVTFVLFGTPEDHIHRVVLSGEQKGRRNHEDPRTMDLWWKLKWSLHFWLCHRGVGWNWRVKNVDDVPERLHSRIPFIKSQLVGLLRCYIATDLMGHYVRASPYGRGVDAPPLLSDNLSHQILFGWLNAVRSYFDMDLGYRVVSLLAVGLGLTEPALWPPMFGSFAEAYTMRKLWGYSWHQNCRMLFQGPCNLVLNTFRIPKGSLLSRYVQLYFCFFISALFHHFGALNTPYLPTVGKQFLFFMLQPVAITFEDCVIHIGKKLGIRLSVITKTTGCLWVVGFLSFSLRYMSSYSFQLGVGALENPLVWSIADRVL